MAETISVRFPDGHIEELSASEYQAAKLKYDWLGETKHVTDAEYQVWLDAQKQPCEQCRKQREVDQMMAGITRGFWRSCDLEVSNELGLDGVVRMVSRIRAPLGDAKCTHFASDAAQTDGTLPLLEKLEAWLKSPSTYLTASLLTSISRLNRLFQAHHPHMNLSPQLALHRLRQRLLPADSRNLSPTATP